MEVMVWWTGADGGEHEERWPSVERFRTWALAQGLSGSFRAYREDADGEWEQIDAGRLGGG